MTGSVRPEVSVIIVSYGRPAALSLCLTALSGLAYHPFEIIVVACAPGLAAVTRHPMARRVVGVAAPGANVAVSRNAGLSVSGGSVIAFIDDDAIPGPFWLDHLVQPLATGEADLAGGFVIGRNGFDLQWGARTVDGTARHRVLAVPGEDTFLPKVRRGEALRTEGTNMAASRNALAALGGFDTAYRFYLDDTDLNMRARARGYRTASVPRAQVWHRQLPSPRRGAERVPRDLTDIGRSLAHYLSRHCPADRVADALAEHRQTERRRAIRHMLRGSLGPDQVIRLLAGFDAGVAEGVGASEFWDGRSPAGFRPARDHAEAVLSGFDDRTGPGFRAQRLGFEEPGLWVRRGGRFGRRCRVATPDFAQGLSIPADAVAKRGTILGIFPLFV